MLVEFNVRDGTEECPFHTYREVQGKHRKEMKFLLIPFHLLLRLHLPVSSSLVLGLTDLTVLKVVMKQHFTEERLLYKTFDNFFSQVKVIIEKSDKFDILMASNEINATGHQQTILVPSEDGATVLFPIKPIHLGEIPITVTAVSLAASDAVTQKILVKVNI